MFGDVDNCNIRFFSEREFGFEYGEKLISSDGRVVIPWSYNLFIVCYWIFLFYNIFIIVFNVFVFIFYFNLIIFIIIYSTL